ncbi:hypothetical protein [Gordonia soli]|uniref:Uncharacterized protein n=1 Tax=Gordonia soli NBRC 108243 TaxID=1223545 RepID=M0QI70_9ACTN|nr:hypothetical protein [Gordonia soli]GAC68315.1 hypothetical protein GS4_14_01480 [Gordonia soli NBRC 108243]
MSDNDDGSDFDTADDLEFDPVLELPGCVGDLTLAIGEVRRTGAGLTIDAALRGTDSAARQWNPFPKLPRAHLVVGGSSFPFRTRASGSDRMVSIEYVLRQVPPSQPITGAVVEFRDATTDEVVTSLDLPEG